MVIYEPCNYVSNIAYYHSATRICDYPQWSIDSEDQKAIKRSFATLAMGSSFFHGSHTNVGMEFDNQMIAYIAYMAHQYSISGFNSSSTILNNLSNTTREHDMIYYTEQNVKMFPDHSVPEWAYYLDTSDIPHNYELTFAAISTTIASLCLPWFIVKPIITFLVTQILDQDSLDFIVNHYIPELHHAL